MAEQGPLWVVVMVVQGHPDENLQLGLDPAERVHNPVIIHEHLGKSPRGRLLQPAPHALARPQQGHQVGDRQIVDERFDLLLAQARREEPEKSLIITWVVFKLI